MNKYFEKATWHPLAGMFPLLADTELQELATDIKERGLTDPIVLYEDQVLDGRNRLLAMKLAGIPLREEYFVSFRDVKNPRCAQGDCTPLSWVVSKNLKRRHLTTSQRAAIAAELEPKFAEEAKKRQGSRTDIKANLPEGSTGQARDKAAEAMQVSPRSVQKAKKLKQEDREAFEKVKKGETTVNAALKKSRPLTETQKQILKLWDAGAIKQKALAEQFGISPAAVSYLIRTRDKAKTKKMDHLPSELPPELAESDALQEAVQELLTRFPDRVKLMKDRNNIIMGLWFQGISFDLDEFTVPQVTEFEPEWKRLYAAD